jgi:hypothetical protein
LADSPLGGNGDQSTSSDQPTSPPANWTVVDLLGQLAERDDQIRLVELELAQTKLALVETQCQNQDLAHQVLFYTTCSNC